MPSIVKKEKRTILAFMEEIWVHAYELVEQIKENLLNFSITPTASHSSPLLWRGGVEEKTYPPHDPLFTGGEHRTFSKIGLQ